MKKALSLFLALVMVFSLALPAFADGPEEDDVDEEWCIPENFGIAKGYVRIKELTKESGRVSSAITRSYNKQGQLLKEKSYHNDGVCKDNNTTKYAYDKKGHLIKEAYYSEDVNGIVNNGIRIYTFNKQGQRTQERFKLKGNVIYSIDWVYDKKGNQIKETYLNNEDSSYNRVITYTYNKQGKPVKEVRRTGSGSKYTHTETKVYSYDKKGNQTKMIDLDVGVGGDRQKKTVVDVYNAKGQMIKSTTTSAYAGSGESYTISSKRIATYAYDKMGKLLKEVRKYNYGEGVVRSVTRTYTYDAKGRVFKLMTTEKASDYTKKTLYTITYDKKGNPLKKAWVSQDSYGKVTTTWAYTYDKVGNLLKFVSKVNNCIGEESTYAYKKIGA